MKAEDKRKARAYKITDTPYRKALVRGQKENLPLAQLIEQVVINYGNGCAIVSFEKGECMPIKCNCLS